jgi:hypothetical protein
MVNVYYVQFECEVDGVMTNAARQIIASTLEDAVRGIIDMYGPVTVLNWNFRSAECIMLP